MDLDFRHSIVTGASCWLATVVAFYLHFGDPWWAAISAWMISMPDPHASRFKSVLRIGGTVAGYWVGSECARDLAGNPLGQAIALFSIAAGGTYGRFRSRYSYAWTIGAVTALMLIIIGITEPGSTYEAAHYRLYEVVAGVVAATVCRQVLGPALRLDAPGDGKPGEPPKGVSAMARRDVVRTAIVGGLLPVVTLLLWARFNLPSVMQIAITTYAVIDQDVATARVRASQRILGCLAGGVLGCLAVFVGVDSLTVWSLFFVGGIIGFSRLHLGKGPWTYVGTQGGVAFIMALVTGDGPPDSIVPVVNRIAGIMFGVLIFSTLSAFEGLWRGSVPLRTTAA